LDLEEEKGNGRHALMSGSKREFIGSLLGEKLFLLSCRKMEFEFFVDIQPYPYFVKSIGTSTQPNIVLDMK
jgi:hypothetical protein